MLFIAVQTEILVYKLLPGIIFDRPIKRLQRNGMHINQIRAGYIGRKVPVLVAADDGGEVSVFFLDDLDRAPLTLHISSQGAWGIALSSGCKTQAQIGISANSHRITIWTLDRDLDVNQNQHGNGSNHSRLTLSGHNHNIPCIDFSPDGWLLASASIDTSVAIWSVHSGHRISTRRISSEWGWAVRWISLQTIKVVCKDDPLWGRQDSLWRQCHHAGAPTDDGDFDGDADESITDDDADVHYMPIGDDDEIEDTSDDEQDSGSDQTKHAGKRRRAAWLDMPSPQHSARNVARPTTQCSSSFWCSCQSVVCEEAASSSQLSIRRRFFSQDDGDDEESEGNEPLALVYCTRRHIFLLDSTLRVLFRVSHAIQRPLHAVPLPPLLQEFDRLSLVEYLPELSLLIAGTQGGQQVFLLRIVRDTSNLKFAMIPEGLLPESVLFLSPIVGLSVVAYPSELSLLSYFHLHVLYANGRLSCYEIRRKTIFGTDIDVSTVFI